MGGKEHNECFEFDCPASHPVKMPELQKVLDKCDNPSEAANPNAFCSDFLTFRGKPKQEGVQVDDFEIVSGLEKIQPDPIDIKATISPEKVTGIPELQRGACKGTLIPAKSGGSKPGGKKPKGKKGKGKKAKGKKGKANKGKAKKPKKGKKGKKKKKKKKKKK